MRWRQRAEAVCCLTLSSAGTDCNNSVSRRVRNQLKDYQLRLPAGQTIPSKSVDCTDNALVVSELMRAFHQLGLGANHTALDPAQFGTETGAGETYVSDGQFMFGINTEIYGSQSSLISAGLSTLAQSGNLFLIHNTDAGNNVAGRLDTFAHMDVLFTMENGVISVRY